MSNIAKRGAQNQPTKTPSVEGDKYTVLLLDEDQLDRFLNRPRFKSLSSHLSRTVDVWPRGHRARIWATAAAVAVLTAFERSTPGAVRTCVCRSARLWRARRARGA